MVRWAKTAISFQNELAIPADLFDRKYMTFDIEFLCLHVTSSNTENYLYNIIYKCELAWRSFVNHFLF